VQRSADEILDGLHLLAIDAETLGMAASLQPATLGTLDAIHLATAVRVADELDVFVTYDRRLARAARSTGLQVDAPA
jgi:uncharacterized protein